MLSSTAILLACSVVVFGANHTELVLVLEVVKLQLQVDSTLDITAHINLEWNSTYPRQPPLLIDQLISEGKTSERQEDLPLGARRVRYFTKISILCENADFTAYPKDNHVCQLRFSSTLNSSRLIFISHIVEGSPKERDVWKTEGSKTFVQWLQSGDQSYEIAVFEFHLQRNAGSLNVVAWLAFSLNILAICHQFPIFSDLSHSNRQLACWVVLIQALICCQLALNAPSTGSWLGSVKYSFGFFCFSVISSVLATLTPSLVLHLHLVPFEAHPSPCDVPIPSDHYSLDSERTRFSAFLDSARLDSSRTPRSANIELCMAELKYTLATLNETMNAKSTAAWRKRLWSTGYGRVETALAILLHGANVCLLLFALH